MNNNKSVVNKKSIDPETRDALDTIGASLYGLSPEFTRTETKLIDNIRQTLSQKLESARKQNGEINNNSNVGEYVTIMTKLMTFREKRDMIDSIRNGAYLTNPSGSYELQSDSNTVNNPDNQLMNLAAVEDVASLFQAHFSLMPEYAKACQLIPELDRAIDTIVRDVINADEVTYTFLNNLYQDDDKDLQDEIETKIQDLLNEYDLETKIKKWVKDSEVMGAKPVSVLPISDVISGINRAMKDGDYFKTSTENDEALETDFLIPNPINKSTLKNYKRLRSENYKWTNEDDRIAIESQVEKTVKNFTRGILDHETIDKYSKLCLEEWYDEIKLEKKRLSRDRFQYDKFVKSVEEFERKINEVDDDEKHEAISKEMSDLVLYMNSFIEVVDDKKAAQYHSLKYKRSQKYSHESDIDKGIIEDHYGVKGRDVKFDNPAETSRVVKDGEIVEAKIDGVNVDLSGKTMDIKSYMSTMKDKRAILTEHDPEHVIPVTNDAGEHIGYFVLEYVRLEDENYSIVRKNRGSFLDILRRLGIGEDRALVAGTSTLVSGGNAAPYNSGVYSPATILSPMNVTNVNGPLTPFGSGFGGRRMKQKNDLIKTIFIKTITKRLKRNFGDDLEKNGTFQSALFNVIKDDMIFKNNVRFTFIPEDHMVYFNRELDSQGFPLSVLDGTLFYIYMFITSRLSALMAKVMKSSNSEVMEINLGLNKNISATIEQIQQCVSTRNVSARTLFGGMDSIIRTVGAYKRMIVPVIDGEKLYTVESMEPVNDVEIDDEFTESLLKSIVLKIGIPPTILDMLSQDEYVASQTQHRIDYRNLIVDRGVRYGKYVTKLIRLIVNYSDMSVLKERSGDNGEIVTEEYSIDLSQIRYKFKPPRAITINKLKDEIDQIGPMVDELIKLHFGDQTPDGNEWPIIQQEVRKELIKFFAASTDWGEIEEIIKKSQLTAVKSFNELGKASVPTTPGDEGDNKLGEADEEAQEQADEATADLDDGEGFGGSPDDEGGF